jgi:hypothetical protein
MNTKALTRAFQLMFRGESKMFEIPCPVPFPECHAPFEGDIEPCSKCGGRGWVEPVAKLKEGKSHDGE